MIKIALIFIIFLVIFLYIFNSLEKNFKYLTKFIKLINNNFNIVIAFLLIGLNSWLALITNEFSLNEIVSAVLFAFINSFIISLINFNKKHLTAHHKK